MWLHFLNLGTSLWKRLSDLSPFQRIFCRKASWWKAKQWGTWIQHVIASSMGTLHRFTGYVVSILQDSTCHRHRSGFTFIYGWICSHTPTVSSSSRWSQDISKNHISNWCDRSSRGRKLAAIPSPPMRPWATRKVSWKPLRTDGWPMVGGWKSSMVPSGYVKIAIENGHL